MKSKNRASLFQISQFVAVGLLSVWPAAARAQTVVATVPVGVAPIAIAVNPVTNKTYVVNGVGQPNGTISIVDGKSNSVTAVSVGAYPRGVAVNATTNQIYVTHGVGNGGGVTVIDGATNATTEINTGFAGAVAVNPVTNKIYVVHPSVHVGFGTSPGGITVVDGATNSFVAVTDPNARFPGPVAINPATNKIYVANGSGNVTVIDGSTNSTTTIPLPNASGISPSSIAVNTTTNKIYVVSNNSGIYAGTNPGNVTVIDGATNSTTTITDSNAIFPVSAAVNPVTNKIYVANALDSAFTGNGGVTVIDGATNAISTVRDPNAIYPNAVAVDSVTDTVYVVNGGCFFLHTGCGNHASVTLINGATNATTTVIDPSANAPDAVAVDATTNKIYVANFISQNTTVIDGGASATSHVLSVLLAGNGSGTVTSNPAGINCGTSCVTNFATGTAVTLSASPGSGFQFSGWSTSCTGTSACNITMNSDRFVTANFNTTSPPDFSLAPAYPDVSVSPGAQATDLITIIPGGGNTSENTIRLSCAITGSTPMPTCSLSPASVTIGANLADSTLTVTVPMQSAGLKPSSEGRLAGLVFAVLLASPGLALTGLGLAGSKSKNRNRRLWFPCGLLIVFAALQAGCGGGSSNPPPPPPALNYTVTVTATSGAIQHTTQVTVTVP